MAYKSGDKVRVIKTIGSALSAEYLYTDKTLILSSIGGYASPYGQWWNVEGEGRGIYEQEIELVKEESKIGINSLLTLGVLGALGYVLWNRDKKHDR